MAINITDLVNINIEKLQSAVDFGTRPIVTVYGVPGDAVTDIYEPTEEESESPIYNDLILVGASSDYNTFYEPGGEETERIKNNDKGTGVADYARIFFQNGGVELIFTARPLRDLFGDPDYKKQNLQNIIWVQYNYITNEAPKVDDNLKDLIGTGIYSKLLIYRYGPTVEVPPELANNDDVSSSIIVKKSGVTGAEMAIAAYLSKMKVYDKVTDYSFTEEFGIPEDLSNLMKPTFGGGIVNYRLNFEMQVGTNKYLNIGGNTLAGKPLVEQFVTVVLTQTLTDRVFDVLSAKLVGQKGLAAIRTAISAELDKYVSSGFLTTNKVWTSNDLIVDNPYYPDHPETIITKNTPLASGYYIHLFKLGFDGQLAYAFILLPTTKGIRYIKIDGRTM